MDKFKKLFIDYIKSYIPDSSIVSGGSEIVCRCRYCLDTNSHHGHLYIKVPSDDTPPLFHCFKCQTSGVLNSKVMIEWGIYNPEIGIELDKLSKRTSFTQYEYDDCKFQLYPYVSDVNLANIKLAYLNQRLGTSLSIADCQKNKIVLNLKDTLDYNRIYTYTRHNQIISHLNNFFVGFVSLDNNFVNLRRICNEGTVYKSIDSRYINYNIHGKNNNTEKIYVLPSTINLNSPERINIHIAEGPMDILSIRYNLRTDESGIFLAATGSGYKGAILHLINKYGIFYFNLHIYPDNDRCGNVVEDIDNTIFPYGAILYEHRNIYPGEKDFGVSSSHISERIIAYK